MRFETSLLLKTIKNINSENPSNCQGTTPKYLCKFIEMLVYTQNSLAKINNTLA